MDSNDQTVDQPVAETVLTRTRKISVVFRTILIVLAAGLLVVTGVNYLFVMRPVSSELRSDSRNTTFTLRAHFQYYVVPNTLVLNLAKVESASPLDLYRGVFEAAKALQQSNQSFQRVVLARSRKAIFVLDGSDFKTLGVEYAEDENPVYMVRTLPEKLYAPDGTRPFGTWEGGLIGVLGKQMEDANTAAATWAGSSE